MQLIKTHKSFGGQVNFWTHQSVETRTPMRFATFEPKGSRIKNCLIWLSGLTCTEENFIVKSGIQRLLADSETMVIAPDTSPRGLNLPGEHDSYDFGSGAGFYLDATRSSYHLNYRMFSYVSKEITTIAINHFGAKELILMGHSMGGHGALVIGLRQPELFRHIVAFAPIVNPGSVPWGQKAFTGYLDDHTGAKKSWALYDSCELLKQGYKHPKSITIYQGTKDEFWPFQLQPEKFKSTADEVGQPCELIWCDGYDHSYYFIASHLEDACNRIFLPSTGDKVDPKIA